MHPAPIPDEIARTRVGRRTIVASPHDPITGVISPVEAIVERGELGKALSVRCVLDQGDLDKLADGGAVWVTFLGHMVPFDVQVGL